MPRSYIFKLSYLRQAHRCDYQFAQRISEIGRVPLGAANRITTNFTLHRAYWDGVNDPIHTVAPAPGYVNRRGDTITSVEPELLSNLLTCHITAGTASEHQAYLDAEVVLTKQQCRALNLPVEYAVQSF